MNINSDTVTTVILGEDKTCLCVVEDNNVSLPFSQLPSSSIWREQCAKDIKDACGLVLMPDTLFGIHKVWQPSINSSSNPYIIHCVFSITIALEAKRKCLPAAGKFVGKLKWLTELELQKYYRQDYLCSPIFLEIYPKLFYAVHSAETFLYPHGIYCTDKIIEVPETVTFENAANYESTLDSSGLKIFQPLIYRDFIKLCYPSFLMCPVQFCKAMIDLGIPRDDTSHLFRAADLSKRKFLSFKDYLCLLAALEPSTNHGGVSGEIRCRYIFSFFDRDSDGFINYRELKDFVIYLRKSKGQPVDPTSVEKEHKSYGVTLNITPTRSISLLDFLRLAGELKIRGLSQVLRFPKSMKIYYQYNMDLESAHFSENSKILNLEMSPRNKLEGAYAKCEDFEIAAHSIRIKKSGTMINLEEIWDLKDVCSDITLQRANITRDSRKLSCEINSQNSVGNELIRILRLLVSINKAKSGNRGNKRELYQWGQINNREYAEKLIRVCSLAKEILANEPRLLDLRSPIYILGDFHGNYGDLQYFEKMFWPLCPGFCPCGLLFLGDYVDRGNFGLEVITYLFCYKVLYPNKIHLIRGNHEIREIQKSFTFFTECTSKFGDKLGIEVWDEVNSVFDNMPLAGVVDGKIFCCHGGIPPPWLCPIATAINNIPIPLSHPDLQSPLAWELMWNDPIRESCITPELAIELKANDGFAMNTRRGTAHVFNSDSLDRFLNINGFSHVVRAHEMVFSGYNVLLKGKLLTVFSSSRYNNTNNEAACILVDNGKMRMMRLDPTI